MKAHVVVVYHIFWCEEFDPLIMERQLSVDGIAAGIAPDMNCSDKQNVSGVSCASW
jgi:hypothetical protein